MHDVATALKELDRRIYASLPQGSPPANVSEFLDEQGQVIADALEALDARSIQTVAHATFHDFSHSPRHRETARRWFQENRREAKKARYVFDRFDGLARLHHMKEALSNNKSDAQGPTALPGNQGADTQLSLSQESLEFLFVHPNLDGDYSPAVVEQIRRLRQNRTYIFLAFPPKCGGTFIRDVLGRVAGIGPDPSRPSHALGGRDCTPYLPLFAMQMLSPTGPKALMTHAHMIGHFSNIQMLKLFGIKPVVMKRSIPDMLCSFADMVQSEGRDRFGNYNWSILCGVHTDPSFLKLDLNQRLDLLVYHQAPWYIQFYASWLRADRKKLLPVHWTVYDAFRADQAGTISAILKYYELPNSAADVADTVARAQADKRNLRFNKGVSGRGASMLTAGHMKHLHQLAAAYPDIDFVAEGLLPPAQ